MRQSCNGRRGINIGRSMYPPCGAPGTSAALHAAVPARTYTPMPIVRRRCRPDPCSMATTSHRRFRIDTIPSSGARVHSTLAVIEGTLSQLASETAVAAESLRDDRDGPAPAADADLASWWLHRLVRAALATRDTCRAARAAIDDRGPSDNDEGCSAPPQATSADAASHSFRGEPQHDGRWIVVGYDGSQAAERALLRAADEAGERDAVVIVTSTTQLYSAGPAAEPLLEPTADPAELLAAAKATVTARASLADVVVVAREGDPAEELLEVARAANADLVIIGRRGKDFVARTLLGSVATRVVQHAPCDVLVVA
jgi:nucleotide-binding universal stress UspA family protein